MAWIWHLWLEMAPQFGDMAYLWLACCFWPWGTDREDGYALSEHHDTLQSPRLWQDGLLPLIIHLMERQVYSQWWPRLKQCSKVSESITNPECFMAPELFPSQEYFGSSLVLDINLSRDRFKYRRVIGGEKKTNRTQVLRHTTQIQILTNSMEATENYRQSLPGVYQCVPG